jgi:hypothetical protein
MSKVQPQSFFSFAPSEKEYKKRLAIKINALQFDQWDLIPVFQVQLNFSFYGPYLQIYIQWLRWLGYIRFEIQKVEKGPTND